MRTETRTYEVYNLHELTKEAQAKAHSHWAEHFDYSWADENEKTLQAFEQTFNIKVDRWSYDRHLLLSLYFSLQRGGRQSKRNKTSEISCQ